MNTRPTTKKTIIGLLLLLVSLTVLPGWKCTYKDKDREIGVDSNQ